MRRFFVESPAAADHVIDAHGAKGSVLLETAFGASPQSPSSRHGIFFVSFSIGRMVCSSGSQRIVVGLGRERMSSARVGAEGLRQNDGAVPNQGRGVAEGADMN